MRLTPAEVAVPETAGVDTAQGQSQEPDRVRAHSPAQVNHRVDAEAQQCLERLASADRETITRHVDALEREWDVERYLQLNAGMVSLTGLALGAALDRRFLALPVAVFSFFLQHAVQGWCPPLPLFRRLGVRTRREINREKYALKALRGDLDLPAQADAPPAP